MSLNDREECSSVPWSTSSMYPRAGVWNVSAIPKTQTSCEVAHPLWFCGVINNIIFIGYIN